MSGLRTIFLACILVVIGGGSLLAQRSTTAAGDRTTPPAVTDDAERLLQLGQLYMGQNNPEYALQPAKLDATARNDAGGRARRIFQQLTARFPDNGDGWLWLGISYTETLRYTPKAPKGERQRSAEEIADGLHAFRTAYESKPDDIVYAVYYGEALMTCSEDFDGARKLWDKYLKNAKTDMQRVMALTQSARACLNKAYFGKMAKKLPGQEIRQLFLEAEDLVAQAVRICPKTPDVKTMQELLDKYRPLLGGK